MRAVACVLALCMAMLAPTYGTPTPPYKVIHLQQPSAEDIAQAMLNVQHLPALQAKPKMDVKLPENPNSHIMNGQLAEEGEIPYQVALNIRRTNSTYFCGASITEYNWILTAAHCVPDDAQWILVFAGSTQWRSAPIQVYVESAYVHSNYDSFWLLNDIALLKLSEPLPESDTVKKVERETSGCGSESLTRQLAVVSGWGQISDYSSVQDDLRLVNTRVISNNICYIFFGPSIIDSTMCSMNPQGLEGVLCSGDSGGPLVSIDTGRQIGINSFVSAAGCYTIQPSGYARVPCHTEWIEKVLNN